MYLTNWLQRILSRTNSSRSRGACAVARRRERALAHGQRRLECLEARTLLASDYSDAPDTAAGTGVDE